MRRERIIISWAKKLNNNRIIHFLKNFRNRRNQLLFLFVIAFITRFIVVLIIDYPFYEVSITHPTQDPITYHQLALSLLDGEGMKSGEPGQRVYHFQRTPLYPIFLAGIYAIFGEDIFYVQIFQIFIGALTVVLFFLLCLEYFNVRLSFISAFIFALYLPHAVLSITIMTEIFTTFFITSSLLLISRAYKKNSYIYWLLTGLSMGFLVMNRQFYKYTLIFISFAIIIIYFKKKKHLFKNLISFLIPIFILISPWIFYVKSHTGQTRIDTFTENPYAIIYTSILLTEKKLGYYDTPEALESLKREMHNAWRLDTKSLFRESISHILRYPCRFIKTTLYGTQTVWLRSFVISGTKRGNMLVDVSPLMKKKFLYNRNYFILFIDFLTFLFAFAGIIGFIKWGLKTLPMAFTVFFTLGIFSFLFPGDRYGIPVHHIIILYSVAAIDWIFYRVKSRTKEYEASPIINISD